MKKNLVYGLTVDRAHHIIIGNEVPNLECEMKLDIRTQHECLGKGGRQGERLVDFLWIGRAAKKIKPGDNPTGLIQFPSF